MERVRQCRFGGYSLTLYDIYSRDDMGKDMLRYVFKHGRKVIFDGADFACSPLHAIDSDSCIKSVMGFLTLRVGDTDAEYFDGYNDVQKAFRDNEAEDVAMMVYDRFGEE